MSQLFSQLGIDWRLLLSQAVNFFLLLVILRMFVYKPLLAMLHERRRKIEEGIMKADEAERRLHDVDIIGKEKVKEAENKAMNILKQVETDAGELQATLLQKTKEHEAAAIKNADERIRAREAEAERAMTAQAAELVKAAIVKTVELSPEKIDEALIARALKEIKVT